MEKAWDDALLAYGQNGEALRPEQGYPARLFLPGWEGNANVKWIRRIEVADRPFMTREETSKYTDPLADGTARMFSFVMDAKSIITFPAYPVTLPGRGWWDITGIAWSGRGRITRVDVSTDGGGRWAPAVLQQPVFPKCHTRFRYLWNWGGRRRRRGSPGVGHRCDAGRERVTRRERHGIARRFAVPAQVRRMPRQDGNRRAVRPARGPGAAPGLPVRA